MIKFDYLIRRDEGDSITEFRPNKIPSDLPLLSYIQGPNASGKSTLLNLIALAFFGLNLSKEELNPDLKERVKALVDATHQNVKFKIEIENEALGLKLISEKRDLEKDLIIVKKIEGGKEIIINENSFKNEFKLVYDIPNNPLGRLPLLLYSLRDQQKNISVDLVRLREEIRNIIDEIKESRDPEQIIHIKERIKDNENFFQESKLKEEQHNIKVRSFGEYYYARFSSFYKNERIETENRITEIQKTIRTEKKNQTQSYRNYMALTQHLNENIQIMKELFESIKLVLPKLIETDQKQRYKLWSTANLHYEIYHPDIYSALRTESESFIKQLNNKILVERSRIADDLEKKKLLQTLVAILIDYKENKFYMPGTSFTIADFLEKLQDDLVHLEETTSRVDNVNKCSESLDRFLCLLQDAITTAENLKEQKVFTEVELENFSLQKELEDLSNRIKVITEKIKELETFAIKHDIDTNNTDFTITLLENDPDFRFYETFNENQITEKLDSLQKKSKDLHSTSRKLERRIEDQREDLKQIESQEPHKYQNNFAELQKALGYIQNMEQLFHNYDSWLANIISNPEMLTNLSVQEIAYLDHIGKFLAKKIGRIMHIGKFHKIKSVDVLNKKIFTDGGTVIKFSDLSTGQGQEAFLEGLLSMSENKKIIAMFDEVAMMDDNTLKPIKDKLKNLYNEKKLLLAMIVQKGNEVKVEDILCSPQ